MEAVFAKDNSSLFPSSPVHKSYYCPTTPTHPHTPTHPRKTPTHPHTPTHPRKTPTHPHKTTPTHPHRTHWDLVPPVVSIATTESILSNSGSSKFNESWPSHSEVTEVGSGVCVARSGGGVVSESCGGSNARGPPTQTLANYVERFRQAPATDRRSRETPSYSFWWRLDQDHVTPPGRHVTPPGCHVTPPRTPQDHSTPDNTSKTSSTSIRVSSLVDTVADDSLETRSQEVIDKSSSAVKYLNSHHGNSEAPTTGGPIAWADAVESGDDILYQWRLQRRLEVARSEVANSGGEWDNQLLHCQTNRVGKSGRMETEDHPPPSQPHRDRPPPSQPHRDRPPPSQPHREERPPPSQLHKEERPPPSQPHGEDRPPPSQPHREERPPPSQLHREERPPPSQLHKEERPPPSQPHGEDRPPPSQPHREDCPPPSQPHREERSQPHNDDASLSDFSLDFTTELEPTSQGPITSTALVQEVIVQRLFGDPSHIPHTPTPPGTPLTPHTPTPPGTPLTPHTPTPPVEPRSNSSHVEVPPIPWDHHMDDDLLKSLIKRVKLFEEYIRTVDVCLAAMETEPSTL